jgi:pyrroloquinoline quinone biosynthesis protein B
LGVLQVHPSGGEPLARPDLAEIAGHAAGLGCYVNLVTSGTLVYAPCLGAWPPGFDEFVTGADCVLLDGTFHAADELTATADGDQRAMGHLPVTDSAPMLRRHPTIRWIYTHLNNTNPLLDTTSRERVASDAEVLPDGAQLDL